MNHYKSCHLLHQLFIVRELCLEWYCLGGHFCLHLYFHLECICEESFTIHFPVAVEK